MEERIEGERKPFGQVIACLAPGHPFARRTGRRRSRSAFLLVDTDTDRDIGLQRRFETVELISQQCAGITTPSGLLSASTDKRDTTVVDLVGDAYPRRQLFPAGRLDKTSTGFVLLTDDGTFAHDILAPKRHVSKTYTVVLDTPLTEQMRTGFAAGVTLADGTALSPAEVTALSADGCTVRVVLKQGVYHQIKRMFGVYGAGVNGLHRDAIGGLALDPALAPGQWRELSAEEVSKISS